LVVDRWSLVVGRWSKESDVRLAFTTLACPAWSFEQAAAAAKRYGYTGIELRLFDGELVTPAMPRDQRERARRVCAEAGLAICCVDTSFKLADPAASLDEAYGCLELAAALDSPLIRLFGGAPPQEGWDTTVRRAAERLVALAERGRRLGVRVALETHDSFSAGRAIADVLAAVPDDFAGALWDTLHPYRAGETAAQTFELIGGRLLHMHIKDGGVAPEPSECRLLGEGRAPIQSILETVLARGYDGWLSVEWEKKWQPQIAEPEVALPQYAEKLREFLKGLA
jgi:sugar phosphate isomerase/epimerase